MNKDLELRLIYWKLKIIKNTFDDAFDGVLQDIEVFRKSEKGE